MASVFVGGPPSDLPTLVGGKVGTMIVTDTNACIAGWGPCENVGMWAAHECKRPAGHGGRHVCVCGSWSNVKVEDE